VSLSSLTVVVPAFNEALAIRETLERILADLPPAVRDFELLVVDDGSADATPELVRALAAREPRVRLEAHPRNAGKGRALRTGFAAARCDWVLFLDADQQVRIEGLRRVAERERVADAVIGYRADRRDTPRRRAITALFRLLVRVTLGIRARDVNCPFKLCRRELIQSLPLRSDGFLVDAEILHLLARRGVSVEEIPVEWHPRRHGKSTLRWTHLVQLARELVALISVRRGEGGP
jgi:dolichol-phosphate mannosyltransferase